MTDHIPDPIQRGEMSAERAYDEMSLPGGLLECPCGTAFDPDKEGGTASPNPYAMPVCGKCFDEATKVQLRCEECGFIKDFDVFDLNCEKCAQGYCDECGEQRIFNK